MTTHYARFPLVEEEEDVPSDSEEKSVSQDEASFVEVTPSPKLPGSIKYADSLLGFVDETPMSDNNFKRPRRVAAVSVFQQDEQFIQDSAPKFNFTHPRVVDHNSRRQSNMFVPRYDATRGPITGASAASLREFARPLRVKDPVFFDRKQASQNEFVKEMKLFVESTPIPESVDIVPPVSVKKPATLQTTRTGQVPISAPMRTEQVPISAPPRTEPVSIASSLEQVLTTFTCPSSVWGFKSVLFNSTTLDLNSVPKENVPLLILPSVLYLVSVSTIVADNGLVNDPSIYFTCKHDFSCQLIEDKKLSTWAPRLSSRQFLDENLQFDIRLLPCAGLIKNAPPNAHFLDMQVSCPRQGDNQVLFYLSKVMVNSVKVSSY